ncbi:MAG: hypothetical protein ACRD52_12475 [Candidatus Acidiferrales bacterium]
MGNRKIDGKPASTRRIAVLPVLQAIKHQLHAGRHTQLVENPKQIIADDLFLRRGWTPARIVTWSCAVSAVFAVAARMALRIGPIGSVALFAAGAGVLMAGGMLLGSLREEDSGFSRTITSGQSGDVNSAEPRFRIAK